jgi:uncharacterized damage-inducible protein DinB
MTIADVRILFAFNQWATDRILAAVEPLNTNEFTRDMRTSHVSVRGTLVHTLWAEWVWFRRWEGESPKILFNDEDFEDVESIASQWRDLDGDRKRFVATLTDDSLARTFAYENRKGEHWEYPLGVSMQHMVNHSSYHRGQIVTLLRQLGKTPPATDFLIYFDEGEPGRDG